MEAILVKEQNGQYEITESADASDWDDVKRELNDVVKVENLTGWGEWTEVYRGTTDWGETQYYFVREG